MADNTFEEDSLSVSERMAAEALIVDVDGFEGPLDLLLTLSRTQKVDLRKISVLQLARQYLEFVEKAKVLRIELAADYLVMAVAGTIWLLLAGRIVGGIASATYATASAYVADISKPEEKAKNFGLIGASFGIGFVLGPALGGLLGEFGTRAPFYVAAGLASANTVLGYFVLKESVTDSIRRFFQWRRANPLGALLSVGKLPGLTALLLQTLKFFVPIKLMENA